MKTGAALIGMLVTAGVGIAVGMAVKSGKEGGTVTVRQDSKVGAAAPAGGGAQPQTDVFKVPVASAPIKGPADALVTIVEFSDFECPFCSRVVPTLKQIQQEYGDKVRIAFRHNPLPFHQNAQPAAEWAIAAQQQGKFWEMHDKLFENNKALDAASLERYAGEIGLDVEKAKAFIATGAAKEQIKADQTQASKVGARGTPAFFVNGVNISGAQPFENFKKVIDAELPKAEKLLASGTSKDKLYEAIIANGRDTPPPPPPQQAPPPATRQKVELVAGTPSKGASEPLVTIVEWSDFECPFCGRVGPTLKQIEDTYGKKVQIQFRHQPLPFHPRAMPAAKASVAAAKQGKFWEMHDKMFANQKALGDAELENYAKEIGLNIGKWKADMESPETKALIEKDMADGSKYGARGTPSFFVNGVPVRGALPFDAFKATIDKELEIAEKYLASGTKKAELYNTILEKEAGKAVAEAAPPAAPPAPSGPVDVKFGKAPVKGKTNAPVQLILYSDFECPFCGRVNPTLEEIKKTYGDKVAVAFKHYPLPFHPSAKPAAIASLAAHKQGKFWEMHDKMFANQRALNRDNFVAWAKELGLDVAKFTKDLDDPALAAWVDEDTAEGQKFGVNGTPATFVNGRLVSGAQPVEAFKSIIDEELKKRS